MKMVIVAAVWAALATSSQALLAETTAAGVDVAAVLSAREALTLLPGVQQIDYVDNDGDHALWQLAFKAKPHQSLYYDACFAIASNAALNPLVDVRFVDAGALPNDPTGGQESSFSRFNCSRWQFYKY